MSRRTCPKCHAGVLVGLDREWCAITVTLDAAPVDAVGELLALSSGRRTFSVRTARDGQGVRRVFEERSPQRISATSLLPRPIHAEHRCGQPLPAAPDQEQPTGWDEEIRF